MSLIADKAVLAVLTKGAWRPSKLHKQETAAENQRHGLADKAKVIVTLTDHSALKTLQEIHNAAYSEHCKITLPSETENMRFLPRGRQVSHAEAMAKFRQEHVEKVDAFLKDYPDIKEKAKKELNGLYREEFFPPISKVERKFKFTVKYLEVPTQGAWQDWLNESMEQAQEDLRLRFREALERMVERLSKDDAVFRDTLVSNLADLVSLTGDLNLTNNPTFTALATAAQPLTEIDPQLLRDDKEVRKATAEAAAAIMSKFL